MEKAIQNFGFQEEALRSPGSEKQAIASMPLSLLHDAGACGKIVTRTESRVLFQSAFSPRLPCQEGTWRPIFASLLDGSYGQPPALLAFRQLPVGVSRGAY